MKQSEKMKNTHDRILSAAIKEFGEKGYDNTSLNVICDKYNISKGLIYHNFKNKDELYLCSVEECVVKLVEYLNKEDYSVDDSWENMKKVLILRQEFFDKFHNYRNVFFGAVLAPPNHLIKEIKNIKKEYDLFNIEKFKKLLKNIKLKKSITEEMAISYFLAYQEMFNGYFQNKIYNDEDLSSIVKAHDLKLLTALDVMLYGIALEENTIDRNNERRKNKNA